MVQGIAVRPLVQIGLAIDPKVLKFYLLLIREAAITGQPQLLIG
jgi:hypothetical protein